MKPLKNQLEPASTDRTSPVPLVSRLRSPKRDAGQVNGSRAGWFKYYAGFSTGFVEDVIDHLEIEPGTIILDPWLGTGTTAEVAASRGYQVQGCDLNPVMLLIARARLVATKSDTDISSLVKKICEEYESRSIQPTANGALGYIDPLEQWLQPASGRAFRSFEACIDAAASKYIRPSKRPIWTYAGQIHPVLAFLYVGLFRTLRYYISRFQSSNPTWIKVSKRNRRIQLSAESIYKRFLREISYLEGSLKSENKTMPLSSSARCTFRQASSMKLPIKENSIDVVVSSPPYCTRIDYVRATLPELAVIGFPNGESIRDLREQMLGTPTISKMAPTQENTWGPTCNQFLSRVKKHTSKASASYYLKYYQQYFFSAFSSLNEINRVLKESGRCVLVVQDSYYKDVLNDLPTIFCEMATEFNWVLENKVDFSVKRTLAGINPEVRQYRNNFQAVEAALIFRKKMA